MTMMIHKSYSIEPEDFEKLRRLAESQHRKPEGMVRVIILERLAQCEQERRETGATSLFPASEDRRKQENDALEQMPSNPLLHRFQREAVTPP